MPRKRAAAVPFTAEPVKIVRKGAPFVWVPRTIWALVVENNHASLGMFVQSQGLTEWTVVAVETDGHDVNSVLNSHAHDLLGTFPSPEKAQGAAERYARTWLKRDAKPTDKCGCDTIATSKSALSKVTLRKVKPARPAHRR